MNLPKILICFALAASLIIPAGAINVAAHARAPYLETVRVEDDFNLSYPVGKSDEIVAYLKSRYIDDQSFVNSLGSEFSSSYGDEVFTDKYFDTPGLDLYQRRAGLRHRLRVDLLDPNSEKSGRELIQLKLSAEDKLLEQDSSGSRNEIKFDVVYPDLTEKDDFHPVIGLIHQDEREQFKVYVQDLKINPYKFKQILVLQQHRRRIYLNLNGETFISFSIDDVKSARWWAKAEFSQMEIELNEVAYTGADQATKDRMHQIREEMIQDLREQFGYLQDDTTIKYTKTFDLLAEKIFWFKFWILIGVL